jgi:hypothetical protein
MRIVKIIKIIAGGGLLLFIMAGFSPLSAKISLVPVYQLLLSSRYKPIQLSETQQQILRFSGYPQLFIKWFRIENDQLRVDESWFYPQESLAVSFINGQFAGEEVLTSGDPQGETESILPGEFHPDDYHYNDTPQTIIKRHGPPLFTRQAQVWNGSADIYAYENLAFAFNNGELRSVMFATRHWDEDWDIIEEPPM